MIICFVVPQLLSTWGLDTDVDNASSLTESAEKLTQPQKNIPDNLEGGENHLIFRKKTR